MKSIIISTLLKQVSMMFAAVTMIIAVPVHAQIRAVDPNDAIGKDSTPQTKIPPPPITSDPVTDPLETQPPVQGSVQDGVPTDPVNGKQSAADPGTIPATTGPTYQKDDLLGAAEGVFGKGAKGLAGLIEKVLKKQGEPNAYIVGREGGGAFVVGLRYGSGTMYHKVEGEKPAYWTGPSIGFDAGANAGSTFVLVYNLYDSEDLYKRFPSAEGVAYMVGGFNASYLRRGDVVLIPIRVGAGLRLGANVGYMKFSKKQRWLPF